MTKLNAMIIFLVSLLSVVVTAEGTFKAGFAKVDVTPTAPVPMWGYGDRHDLLSMGTRDPLYAKALVIETDSGKAALVGLDLGRAPGDPEFKRILDAVEEQAGVSAVLFSGSHTHHGPVMELMDEPEKGQGRFDDAVAYRSELEKKLIQLIVDAAQAAVDAQIGWSSVEVDMNRNRQAKVEPKPRDTELSVLRVDDRSGKPIAVMVSFAAHPTVLSAADLRFSAEYPGVMMNAAEAALGTDVLFMQGAAGDLSVKTTKEDLMDADDPALSEEKLDAAQTTFLMEAMKLEREQAIAQQQNMIRNEARMVSFGKRMAEEVITLVKNTETAVPEKPGVASYFKDYEFPSRVNFNNPVIVKMFGQAFFPELANASMGSVENNMIRTRLSVLVLNNELAFVGGSGEFFSDHANRIKARSHATKTFFVGYCNGHNMYFPTIEGAAQGGYGADAQVSWVSLGAGEIMMNDALVKIYEILGDLSLEQMGS